MAENRTESGLGIDYVRPIFGIINYFSASFYIAVLVALQTSQDKSHHTAFFIIYKVTAIYGIMNMLTTYDFGICNHTPWVYKSLEFFNTLGSFCFVTGCLLIEIQRYLSSPIRLCLVLTVQFLIFFLIQTPLIRAGVVENKRGCIDDLDPHYQRVIRTFVGFFYCFYVVSSLTLTTLTIRRLRSTQKLNNRGHSLHLSLVRYSIWCSFAQMSKGILQMISSFALFTQNEAIKDAHLILYYPINLIAINSTLFLLLFFSRSVRRRVLKVYCCRSSTTVKVTSVVTRTEEISVKPACGVTPIR